VAGRRKREIRVGTAQAGRPVDMRVWRLVYSRISRRRRGFNFLAPRI